MIHRLLVLSLIWAAGIVIGLGNPEVFADWLPYIAYGRGEAAYLDYLGPPWLKWPLTLLGLLPTTWSYLLVSAGGFALIGWALRHARMLVVLIVGCAMLPALDIGQITPLLAGLCLIALDKTTAQVPLIVAVLLLVAIKPTTALPVGLVLMIQDRLLWVYVILAFFVAALAVTHDVVGWLRGVQEAVEARTATPMWSWQFGTLRWLPWEHKTVPSLFVTVPAAWGVIHDWAPRPWLWWLFALAATPWLFHYDAIGFGSLAFALIFSDTTDEGE